MFKISSDLAAEVTTRGLKDAALQARFERELTETSQRIERLCLEWRREGSHKENLAELGQLSSRASTVRKLSFSSSLGSLNLGGVNSLGSVHLGSASLGSANLGSASLASVNLGSACERTIGGASVLSSSTAEPPRMSQSTWSARRDSNSSWASRLFDAQSSADSKAEEPQCSMQLGATD